MNKFNEFVKEARKESNRLSNKFGTMVYVSIQIEFDDKNKIFELNPYCINLKSYEYNSVARSLMSGKYIKVPNLTESDFYKNCLKK